MKKDTTPASADAVGSQLVRGVGRLRPKRYPGPRRCMVADRRHSECAMPLDRLDWQRWFTDGAGGSLYLHVWSKDGETCHRVYCRHTEKPRLSCEGGVLRWLVDAHRDKWPWPDNKTPNVRAKLPDAAAAAGDEAR